MSNMVKKILSGLAVAGAIFIPASFAFAASPALTVASNGDLSMTFNNPHVNTSGGGAGIDVYDGVDSSATNIASYYAFNDYSTGGIPSPLTISAADGSLNWTPRTQDPQFYQYIAYSPSNITSGNVTVCVHGTGTTECATATVAPPVCSPSTISHGTIGSYPTCTVTCNGGYNLTGGACVANSGGGTMGGTAGIPLPTSTWSTLTASAAQQVRDPGLLMVVGGVAGVYLAFYFMRFVVGLIPRGKKRRQS
jgi:hypothetical protein